MTPQLPPDTVIYQDQDCALILIKGDRLMAPRDLGLQVSAWSTACYRGYVATYTCERDELFLTELHIGSLARGSEWTPIGGVEPETVYITVKQYLDGEWRPKTRENGRRYCNLHVPTGFSGGILVGSGRCGTPGAFILPFSCEQVLELYFHEGSLSQVVEHSAQVADLRDSLPARSYGVTEQIEWLSSLGYEVSRARLSPND